MAKECCTNKFCPSGNPEKNSEVAEGLNVYLANLNVLYVKLHNIHWNVVGVGFFDIHKKTQELYEQVAEDVDAVAERIKMLGCCPLASMQDYLEAATICELPCEDMNGQCAAKLIIDDFCCLLRLVKKIDESANEICDDCTIALMSEARCFFEKQIWLLSAYLTRC